MAASISARASDVFSSDVFATNDPNKDFAVEVMSYDELMAQTPAVRAAYLKNLQTMYLHALELEAKNPQIPDAIGSNGKISELFALLEKFSSEANAMGGGGASSSGRTIVTLGDQLDESTKALAAAQATFDRCQVTPKPMNCTPTTIRNLQAELDAAQKSVDDVNAKIKSSKEHAAQEKATQDKLADDKASAARIAARPAPSVNDMSGPEMAKAIEATRVAREAYIQAKQNYDNCIMRPAPAECTIPETNRRKGTMDRAQTVYERASAKMPSDPRSEPKDAPQKPGDNSTDALTVLHNKNISCRKDTKPVSCVKVDGNSPEAKARQKRIADFERKSKTTKTCITGFLDSNVSGSCQNVHNLKVGTLELNCKDKQTTICNPWLYGASGTGANSQALCGEVPAKGTAQQKAVQIAVSCNEKSAKTKNAIDNFLANSKVAGIKEGWDAKVTVPLNQLCGGPLRMEANCELCQKLASESLLSISKSGAIRKCDSAQPAGVSPNSTVR